VLRIENASRPGGSSPRAASLHRRRSKSFSDLEAVMDQLQAKSARSQQQQQQQQQPGITEEGVDGGSGSVCADESEHRPPRSRLYYAKVGIIFAIVLVSCTIIAATPEKESLFHLYTVSSERSPSINVTPSINFYSVVLVKLRGALLYTPTETSTNITVTVDEVFSAENMSQSLVWTVPIAPVVENEVSEEIVRERYFPLNHTAQKGSAKLSIRVRTNYEHSLPLAVSYETLTNAVYNEVIYAALVLAFVYALIIFELVHRSLAAMLGSLMSVAVLALVNRRPSLIEVIAWLDFETLSLLFGMMVMVGIFSESGFFDWVAVLAFRLAKGRTMALVTLLCLFAAVISAFLDNVTTILLMAPVTIRLCEVLRLDPRQLLIAQVMFSNVGGTATAVGDPPNVIIASNAELAEQGVTFTNFTVHMTLGIVFITVAAYALLRLVYWRQDLESNEDPVAAEIRREVEVWRRTAYGFAVTTSEQAAVKALLQAKICELEHRLAVHRVTATADKPFEQTLAELQQKVRLRAASFMRISFGFVSAVQVAILTVDRSTALRPLFHAASLDSIIHHHLTASYSIPYQHHLTASLDSIMQHHLTALYSIP
uniref:CitMHS domain-containing protein n=1 Tax=Macrostomum lignano TaxID=282301 RepID=A0A1I8IUF5_9PLAT